MADGRLADWLVVCASPRSCLALTWPRRLTMPCDVFVCFWSVHSVWLRASRSATDHNPWPQQYNAYNRQHIFHHSLTINISIKYVRLLGSAFYLHFPLSVAHTYCFSVFSSLSHTLLRCFFFFLNSYIETIFSTSHRRCSPPSLSISSSSSSHSPGSRCIHIILFFSSSFVPPLFAQCVL